MACFDPNSKRLGELEQPWSRVGICKFLPGLTEYEARQMIHTTLARIAEITIKEILKQTGNSIRRVTKLLERLAQAIKRRTGVVRVFPDEAACQRPVCAPAMDTNAQWMERIQLSMDVMPTKQNVVAARVDARQAAPGSAT